jgi:hypothetical protein
MASLAARILPLLVALALGAFALSFVLGPDGPLSHIRETVQRGKTTARQGARPMEARPARGRPAPQRAERLRRRARRPLLEELPGLPGRVVAAVWRALRLPLALSALAGLVLAGLRLHARRRRRYTRHWLLPYRADEATPDQVRRLIESWH